jgi:hypothetical protein
MLPASITDMLESVAEHLTHGGELQGLAAHCQALSLHTDARQAIDKAMGLGLSESEAWVLLAHWACQRPGSVADAAVSLALRPHLDRMDVALVSRCLKMMDQTLGAYASDDWSLSRTQRLRRALSRSWA